MKYNTIIDFWIGHKDHKTATKVIFDPTTPKHRPGLFNLFTGLHYPNAKFNETMKAELVPFLKHIYENVCSRDAEDYRCLLSI